MVKILIIYLKCVGYDSVVAMLMAFQPDMNMKLNTASKAITAELLSRNQIKKPDTLVRNMLIPKTRIN